MKMTVLEKQFKKRKEDKYFIVVKKKKSCAGEKIMQIMKMPMVQFISIESSVDYCLLFLDPPPVMSDGLLVWP